MVLTRAPVMNHILLFASIFWVTVGFKPASATNQTISFWIFLGFFEACNLVLKSFRRKFNCGFRAFCHQHSLSTSLWSKCKYQLFNSRVHFNSCWSDTIYVIHIYLFGRPSSLRTLHSSIFRDGHVQPDFKNFYDF